MKAALLYEFGQPLRVEEAPAPQPLEDEVLVRVEASGVCHSDLHMAHGDWPDVAARMQMPAILGHEVVGRVIWRGAAAQHIPEGARVGVGWLYSTCGACEYCRDGAENICQDRKVTGMAAGGGFAELCRIKASHAIPVPDSVPVEEAAPYFCAGLTVYHALRNAGVIGSEHRPPAAGHSLTVFGVGGLGHIAIQLARNAGYEVTAVDVSDAKLELARRMGATRSINGAAADAVKQLRADGGPHIAVVTAPSKAAYDLAFRVLRRRGTLAVVGLPKEDVTFNADNFVVGEFRIIGAAVGTRDETRALLAEAAAGKLRCEVETHPIDAINDIFDRMSRGALTGRAVIKF